jgi:predicted aminopeptidase
MTATPDWPSIRADAQGPLRRGASATDAPRRRRRRWPIAVTAIAGAVTVAACATFETVDYYWQGAAGQWDLISRSQPIPDVID